MRISDWSSDVCSSDLATHWVRPGQASLPDTLKAGMIYMSLPAAPTLPGIKPYFPTILSCLILIQTESLMEIQMRFHMDTPHIPRIITAFLSESNIKGSEDWKSKRLNTSN